MNWTGNVEKCSRWFRSYSVWKLKTMIYNRSQKVWAVRGFRGWEKILENVQFFRKWTIFTMFLIELSPKLKHTKSHWGRDRYWNVTKAWSTLKLLLHVKTGQRRCFLSEGLVEVHRARDPGGPRNSLEGLHIPSGQLCWLPLVLLEKLTSLDRSRVCWCQQEADEENLVSGWEMIRVINLKDLTWTGRLLLSSWSLLLSSWSLLLSPWSLLLSSWSLLPVKLRKEHE